RDFADVVRIPPPKFHPCDVETILREISLLMRAECLKREITWNWDIQAKIEPVSMDRSQMEQAFVNILKNAAEAIGEKGEITVRIGNKGGRGFVVIEDSGCGFTSEVRSNLFTPFFSTKDNGQGIGLTVIREILERHKFEFSFESRHG